MKKKNHKIFAVLLSALLVVTAFSGCGCKHEIGKWKIVKDSTCTTEGLRRGVCYLCGNVVEESIATEETKHVYADWEITKLPTDSGRGTGEAVKTCTENAEHSVTVTLPRLTEEFKGYKSYEITQAATVFAEGERTLVYEHELGDIRFIVPVAKKELDPTSEDAVENAVMLGASNRSLVRRGAGIKDMGLPGSEPATEINFEYEYGENYAYYNDMGDRRKTWTSISSTGEIFGVYAEYSARNEDVFTVAPRRYERITKKDLEGPMYNISRAGGTFYGAEGLLLGTYQWATSVNTNDGYKKEVSTAEDGRPLYKFYFEYYNVPQYFCTIWVEFTLTEDYAIDYVRLDSWAYIPETEKIDPETGKNKRNFVVDDNGKCTIVEGAQPFYKEFCVYYQEMKADIENDAEPVNPYGEEAFKISDFTITHNGKEILDEESAAAAGKEAYAPAIEAGSGKFISINVKPYPATASFDADPVTIYRLTETGRRIKVDITGGNGAVWGTLDTENNQNGTGALRVYSKLAGDITILLQARSGYEKAFTYKVTAITPSVLYPNVYQYNAGKYTWEKITEADASNEYVASSTVYVGQPLKMQASIDDSETKYVVHGFTYVPLNGKQDTDFTIEQAESENSTGVITFTGLKAGTYTVELRSVNSRTKRARVKITVVDSPTAEDLFTGVYAGRVKYPSTTDVTLSFERIEDDKNGKPQWRVEIQAKNKKAPEYVLLHYGERGELLTDHESGPVLKFKIQINEAYDVVLLCDTGFAQDRVVIFRQEDTSTEAPEAPENSQA